MFGELISALPLITSSAIVGSLMVGVALLALIGVGAMWLSSGNKKQRFLPSNRSAEVQQTPDPLAGRTTQELRLDVGERLVAADRAVESSEQELLFATASYGDDAVAEFTEDVRKAKDQLSEAFKLQYQVDSYDAPEEPEIRENYAKILQLCEEIDTTLQSHAQEFDSMRDLENNPGPAITELRSELDSLTEAYRQAEATAADLSSRFHTDALKQYRENLQRVSGIIETATQHHETATVAAEKHNTADAVLALHQGEEAAADAKHLVQSMSENAERIMTARRNLDIGVEQTEQDIAQAQAIYDAGQAPDLAGPIAAARSALNRTQRALDNEPQQPLDPLRLLESLENAHRELDEPLNSVRDRQAKDRRARETIETELLTARHQVTSSQDFLRSMRHQSSPETRTRMAEAQRLLDEAHQSQTSSPSKAIEQAREAKVLAVRAAQLGQQSSATEAMQSMGGYRSGFGGYGGFGSDGAGYGGQRSSGHRSGTYRSPGSSSNSTFSGTRGPGAKGVSSRDSSAHAIRQATLVASRLMRQRRRR